MRKDREGGAFGQGKVSIGDDVIDLWVKGLPKSDVLHIVSLLGHKTNGNSEFDYYPFDSSMVSGPNQLFKNG